MATTRSVLGWEVSSWCTEREAKELERMGYTVGINGAYVLGTDKAPAKFVWAPGTFMTTMSDELPGKYKVDPGGGTKPADMLEFDDLMAAARYLLIEVSNGA